MGYANWLIPSKTQGSGNDTVNVTAGSNNTGRSARSTNITFTASGVGDVVRQVIQAGKTEFVTMESAKSVSKSGVQTLTITGTSNSSKLTFSISSGATLPLVLPQTYTANSVSTENGVAIVGDPGQSAEFAFSIAFSDIPENLTVDQLTAQLVVTDNAGNEAICTITQAQGDSTLSVAPESVQLDWDAFTEGTSASFTVTSNTNWTVS